MQESEVWRVLLAVHTGNLRATATRVCVCVLDGLNDPVFFLLRGNPFITPSRAGALRRLSAGLQVVVHGLGWAVPPLAFNFSLCPPRGNLGGGGGGEEGSGAGGGEGGAVACFYVP